MKRKRVFSSENILIILSQEAHHHSAMDQIFSADRQSMLAEIRDLRAHATISRMHHQEERERLAEKLANAEDQGSKKERQLKRQGNDQMSSIRKKSFFLNMTVIVRKDWNHCFLYRSKDGMYFCLCVLFFLYNIYMCYAHLPMMGHFYIFKVAITTRSHPLSLIRIGLGCCLLEWY